MDEIQTIIQIIADVGAVGVMAYINIRLWNRLTDVENTHTKYIQDENRRLNDEINRYFTMLQNNRSEIRYSGDLPKVENLKAVEKAASPTGQGR